MDDPLLGCSVAKLLDSLAAPAPAPAGGSAAALAVAMGAGLLAMSARVSFGEWDEAEACAAQAEALRARAAPLAHADAEAFAAVLRLRRERASDLELGLAYDRAAELPLRIAEVGADVAELAAHAAPCVDQKVFGDTAAAAALGQAGAAIGAHLVAINLASREDDERVTRARELAAAAQRAARRAASPP